MTPIAETTLSNKAKEEIEMVEKKEEWEVTGSIGMWQTTFFSSSHKQSGDIQQQLLYEFSLSNFKLMGKV